MNANPEWIPLSAAQRGLFFAHQLDPDNPCYTTAEVVEIPAMLDADVLSDALQRAYGEFEQLRTRFRLAENGPEQHVMPEPTGKLHVVDARDEATAEQWMQRDLARPMDLADGDVVRSALFRLPGNRAWWYHAAHHVVMDGYAAQQLIRRVAQLYAGAPSTPPIPLGEAIGDEPDDAKTSAFWQSRLADYSGPTSLAGRTTSPAPKPHRVKTQLAPLLQQKLATAAARLGTSMHELVIAAIGAYVGRMTGQDKVRVGIPLMNRIIPGQGVRLSAKTVCTQVNVLPLTALASGTLAAAIEHTHAEHQALREQPFIRQELLARQLQRQAPGAQLFGVQINLIPLELDVPWTHADGRVVHGLIRNLAPGPVEDLTITLRGALGRNKPVVLEFDANPALYDAPGLQLHLARLVAFIEAFAEAPAERDIGDIDLLPASERRQVLEQFNATAVEREPATLAERFLAQVERTPHATALLYQGQTRSYAELRDAACRVADVLASRGVGAGDVVGVQLPRCFELFEAIHGIQLRGAVYLPLDPELPQARIDAMLEDANATFVIDAGTAFDTNTGDTRTHTQRTSTVPANVDAPAYLLFTSGSTGRPKGVQVAHRALDNRLAWMQHHLQLQPGERVLHKTPISFDVSVWELFWPLQVGATIVIAPPGAHRDPRAIAALLVDASVQILHFVPSMLRAFLADRHSREQMRDGRVRAVVTSGEALTPDLVTASLTTFGVAPTNLYGPTEAAIDVTCWDCKADDPEIPIGRPVWNTACYVLDGQQRPVPVGVVGELWLAGVQLADGYAGRPELTAERFVPNPLVPGTRMYRTGDLAAWRADGALRYLGRTDDQVKVRGQRVELGEIEAVVSSCEAVTGVAAGVCDGQLVVWYVSAGGNDIEATLRDTAAARLPPSFMPQHWIAVSAIPLSSSGKADRKTLAVTAPPKTVHGTDGAAPSDLLEQRICAAFAETLGIDAVSANDDFFALGGDSLRVLKLIAMLEADIGFELALASVFAHPTPQALARAMTSETPSDGMEEVLALRVPPAASCAPLILLPPAGGLGWCYTGLLRALPAELPVYAIQAPGIASGRPEPVADLSALARRQLRAIRSLIGDGPFHLCGWSLGGMAAHAVAALARSEGQQVGAVVLLDAYPSTQWNQQPPATEHDALIGILRMGGVAEPDDATLDRPRVGCLLREGGSALAALPERIIDGCIAAVIEATRLVRTPPPMPMPGDMTVVVASATRTQHWLDAEGWCEHVLGDLHLVDIDTHHADLVRRPVADTVAALLRSRIATSGV